MKKRPGFMLYFDLADALFSLEDAEAGRLFKALMAYSQTGEVRPLTGQADFAFKVARPRMDKDEENYRERCRRNAYAVYVREAHRRQEVPAEYERWCEGASDDIIPYPTEHNNNHNNNHNAAQPSAAKPSPGPGQAGAAPSRPVEGNDPLFSPAVQRRLEEWLRYKAERKEPYTPTGLQSLHTQLRGSIDRWGEKAVLELMGECMAAGYRGILFDRLGKGGKQGAPPLPEDQEWMRPYLAGRKRKQADNRGEVRS